MVIGWRPSSWVWFQFIFTSAKKHRGIYATVLLRALLG
jgi:hypothetical protein